MTAPDTRGPSDGPVPGAPDLNPFATAEKLMAQWEARHAVGAAGRRIAGPGVSEYLTHERCTEACSSPGRHGHDHAAEQAARRARAQRKPPPDTHPHFSDLLAWVLPISGPDDPPSGRRAGGRH
jgi:hypothetical protein